MPTGESVVSIQTIVLPFLILVYVPVGVAVYWRLIPRLWRPGRRLASIMLAAQVAVILLSLAIQPASIFEKWLWSFSSWQWNESEWNIPATLASTQLALVGGVALLAARFTLGRSRLKPMYYVAVGLVFLFLALDEYLALHENLPNWGSYYAALGSVIVAATTLVAIRSPRPGRVWHFCMVIGLATSATGAMVFDVVPIACGGVAQLQFEGCIYSSHVEESLEFLGIWLALAAVLGQLCDAEPRPSRRTCQALYAIPVLWILLLFFNSILPRLEFPLVAQQAQVEFESGVRLQGFNVDGQRTETIALRHYASARQADYLGLGYSLHLVDQVTGESVASGDQWANRQHGIWLFGPDYAPLYRQWIEVIVPPATPSNRAYWIVLSLWRAKDQGFAQLRALSSDLRLLGDTQVVIGELVLPAEPSDAPIAPIAAFSNGFALAGAEFPQDARAGETLNITFGWRSAVAGLDDYTQFLHFRHEETNEWWVYDQSPLGPRLPTRLWYSGLADSETWRIALPADLSPGRYAVFTGLYRASNLERLPVTDVDERPWPDNRVALGVLYVE